MQVVTRRRWWRALAVVALVEHHSRGLPRSVRPRSLQISGPTAYLPAVLDSLPAALRPAEGTDTARTVAAVGADVIRIGKFDVHRQVRARAFYLDSERSLRVQGGAGVARSVAAHRVVERYAPGLAPRVTHHGSLPRGRTHYLIEEAVGGQRVRSKADIAAALQEVAHRMTAVHQGAGTTTQPLSRAASAHLPGLWEQVVRQELVRPQVGAAIEELLARDHLVEIGLGHGDLVNSNVLRSAGQVVLIDWEYAGPMPIAFDLAKLHLNAGPPETTTPLLDQALGGRVGHKAGHYSLLEQLALAHAQVISRFPARRKRAAVAGRLRFLQSQLERRERTIARLLGV